MIRRLAALLLLCLAPAARAGTLKGTVAYEGPAPKATLPVTKDEKACGKDVPNDSLVVANGLLRNAVVWLEGLKGETRPVEGALLDQKSCRFVPHVLAVTVGTVLSVNNADAVLHNVHAVEKELPNTPTEFNWPMPLVNKPRRITLKKAGILNTRCDAGHSWMDAWVHVFDHPFYAVSGEDGAFEIGNVPDGSYTLVAWHETLGRQEAKVEVKDGTGTVKLTFKPK